jgi:hypothetical protein
LAYQKTQSGPLQELQAAVVADGLIAQVERVEEQGRVDLALMDLFHQEALAAVRWLGL